MRSMYDGIIAAEVPAGAGLYAAYLDGTWADYPAMVARFPGAVHVSIAVSAGYNGGHVLDVENGDATPAQAVNWVLMRRAAGTDPTVYCSMSEWPAVQAAFKARSVAPPHYWVADYSLGENPAIPAGAIALQYADRGGYDVSVVADYWPGVDQAPSQPTQEDDMSPYLISVTPDPTSSTNKGAGIFTVDAGTVVHVDQVSLAELQARFGVPIVTSPTYYAGLLAARPSVVQVDVPGLAAALAPLLPAAPTAEQDASAVLKAQSAAEASG